MSKKYTIEVKSVDLINKIDSLIKEGIDLELILKRGEYDFTYRRIRNQRINNEKKLISNIPKEVRDELIKKYNS